jgi:hypothetical protein
VNDEWEIEKQPIRVLAQANPGDSDWEWTEPLGPRANYSALFRQLALCEETEESIAQFATKFGMLAYGRKVVPAAVGDRQKRFPKLNYIRLSDAQGSLTSEATHVAKDHWIGWKLCGAIEADTFDDWIHIIRDLKTLTRLSDALVQQDKRSIVKLLNLMLSEENLMYELYIGVGQPRLFSRPRDPDSTPLGAARRVLLTEIGKKIETGYLLDLAPDFKSGAPSLALRAPTLRHAIWLQFALAIWENRVYRPCEICGTYFVVSPDVARTDRVLCSQACKQKAHRKRHAQALELARRGLKPAAIAKQVGSGVDTVKRWLQAEKGRLNDRQAER